MHQIVSYERVDKSFLCLLFLIFKGKVKSLVFQGGVFVDVSLTTLDRNGYMLDQLDKKTKKDIESILNDKFCNLNVNDNSQDNICKIQNLRYRVKKEN